jgi:hypothetical protein
MELLLFDLGAALAALLGYRALAVLGRWGKHVRTKQWSKRDLPRAHLARS